MNKQEAQEFYNQRRAQTLSSSFMPDEFISQEFRDLLKKAAMYCSMYKIGCPFLTWRKIFTQDMPFFMAELALCFDILRGASPKELEQSWEENLKMHEEILQPLMDKYLKLEEEFLEPIKREIQTKLKISNGVPDSKKIIVPSKR